MLYDIRTLSLEQQVFDVANLQFMNTLGCIACLSHE